MATRKGERPAPGDPRNDPRNDADREAAAGLPEPLRFLADRQALLRRLALAEILSAPLARRPRRRLGPGSGGGSR